MNKVSLPLALFSFCLSLPRAVPTLGPASVARPRFSPCPGLCLRASLPSSLCCSPSRPLTLYLPVRFPRSALSWVLFSLSHTHSPFSSPPPLILCADVSPRKSVLADAKDDVAQGNLLSLSLSLSLLSSSPSLRSIFSSFPSSLSLSSLPLVCTWGALSLLSPLSPSSSSPAAAVAGERKPLIARRKAEREWEGEGESEREKRKEGERAGD